MEKYKGVKFKLNWKTIPIPQKYIAASKQLALACRKTGKLFPVKGNEGNLSLRTGKNSFLIKGSGVPLIKTRAKDISFIKKADRKRFLVEGIGMRPPSSETFLHALIYRKRKDANTIIHFHADRLLRRAKGFSSAPPLPYGTLKLANATSKAAMHSDVILLEKHGFIVVGETLKSALRKACKLRQ